MKIFISGKISGDKNYKEKFAKAEEEIKKLWTTEVINPTEIKLPSCCEWEDYMKVCINLIDECDAVYFLKDWQESAGACTEMAAALKRNITIIRETK